MPSPAGRPLLAASGTTPELIAPGRLLHLWGEYWRGAVVAAIVVGGLTAFLLLRQPSVYAASATLLVERSNDRVVDIKQVVDDTVESSLTDALMLTHIQQIQSHGFLVQSAASLTPVERSRFLAPYPEYRPKLGSPLFPSADFDAAQVVKLIARNLKVDRNGRTLLITLTLRHRDPAMAQLMANTLAEQYIVYLINRSSASNDSALAFLSSEVADLRGKLENAERSLRLYRESNHLVLFDHEQSILGDRLKAMSVAATDARMARLMLEAHVQHIKTVLQASDEGVRQLAMDPAFAGLVEVQKQLDELLARRSVLSARYRAKHPLMLENTASIRAFENLRSQQITGALFEFGAQLDKAVADEKRLDLEQANAEREALRLDQLTLRDSELRREVDTARESYSQILDRLNQTSISSRLQNTNIKLVDRAGLPDLAVEPNRLRVAFLAFLVGVIIFSAYPWLRDALDKRVRAWSEAEDYLGVPLLAEIPAVAKMPASERGRIVARDLENPAAEAFRSLHGQLQVFSRHQPPKTVLVTSTIPAEGKSFVACNLSASYAAHGRTVLLIDADFRRPSLHRAFELDNDRGLLTWDRKEAEPKAGGVLSNSTLGIVEIAPRFHLLRSGGVSRKMTELLQGGSLAQLLAALQRQFDIIVIDAPPAGVFPDAEVLALLADEVIYICRFKGPNRQHVRQVLDRLKKAGADVAGLVLNAIPVSRMGPNYFSAQGYSAMRHSKYYAEKV